MPVNDFGQGAALMGELMQTDASSFKRVGQKNDPQLHRVLLKDLTWALSDQEGTV